MTKMISRAALMAAGAAMVLPEFGRKHDGADPAEFDIKKVTGELKTALDTVKKFGEDAAKELKAGREMSAELKGQVDAALVKLNTLDEVKARIDEIEQKGARTGAGSETLGEKSYGAQIASSEDFISWKSAGFGGTKRFALKDSRGIKAITAAQAGTAWSERDGTVTGLPKRELTVRDLLSVVQTSSGSVDYARQTTRTNNAAVVAEAAQKPTSNYVWVQATAPVRTIAHIAKLTRQALDDAQQLQGEVDMEMRYGLALAEEFELLSGDGSGSHLLGLIPQATAYAAPYDPPGTETNIDVLRLAFLQVALSDYTADAGVLNPIDWDRIISLKDSTGRYIFANPFEVQAPTLWAKKIVVTNAMTVDKFLVGPFKAAATLYDRMAPEVLIASENADDFEKNLLTMRCEERLALGVKRPASLVYGDFGNVT